MKQSTFSAVMANSIKILLQRYTKGIRFTAILTLLFTIGVGQMLAETIASWTGAERVADTEYAPTTSQTDNSTAKLKSECALSTQGTGGSAGSYYGTWTNDKCIYVTGLNLSSYKDVSLTVYLRRRNGTCTASFYTSTDGSTYAATALDTKTLTNTLTSYSISGIGSNVKAIKILITGGSGNLWLGTLSVEGTKAAVATPTLTATPTSLDFGEVAKNASLESKTFSISGSNLTSGNLSISAPTGYSVLPESVSVNGTLTSKDITVKPNTTTAGTYNGNITISGGGLTSDVKVEVKMTVLETYTITWIVNGETKHTNSATHGGSVTAPDVDKIPCGDVIAGWTDAKNGEYIHETSELYEGAKANISPITSDTTFYAVFADYAD